VIPFRAFLSFFDPKFDQTIGLEHFVQLGIEQEAQQPTQRIEQKVVDIR
jgi:hypothetical protein